MNAPGVMEIVLLIGSLLVLAVIVAGVALVVVRVAGRRSPTGDDARLRAIEERLARLERDRDGAQG